MKQIVTSTLFAGAALVGVALMAPAASAMPMAGIGDAATTVQTGIEKTRWVCGPYRCWNRPVYGYGYGYGWRRPWGWGGYGWRGGYGGWHHGWRRW